MQSHTTTTRERLLVAGAALIAERGFGGASVRAICKQAGASINMVNYCYGSKAGLLAAIVAQYGDHVFAVPMRLLDTPPKSRDDFSSRIEMLFAATLDACIAERSVMMVVLREQANPPALAEYMLKFTAFLEDGKKLGFVREQLDTAMLTGALLDRIVNQVQFMPWIKQNFGTDLADPAYKRRWCASNLDFFLNGMLR